MAKVTSKRQITIPKSVADRYGIESGNDIDFVPAGEVIRLVPRSRRSRSEGVARRLASFDRATERQRQRDGAANRPLAKDRGWRREDLYDGRVVERDARPH